MFGLSVSHLIVLGIIVLLFGGRRLPELGSSMGKALHAFKTAMDGKFVDEDSRRSLMSDDSTQSPHKNQT